MSIKVYTTDTAREIAQKIFDSFQPGDMVVVEGYVMVEEKQILMAKGDAVIECLRWLYDHNYYSQSGKARDYRYKNKSVGGAIAHPIWTWDKVWIDKEPRVTIWRFQ